MGYSREGPVIRDGDELDDFELEELDDLDDEPGPSLGPDERDADLMDGSWETRYYTGQTRSRDWNAVGIGIGLLLVTALVVPLVTVVFQ
jgi:hypothetical protein